MDEPTVFPPPDKQELLDLYLQVAKARHQVIDTFQLFDRPMTDPLAVKGWKIYEHAAAAESALQRVLERLVGRQVDQDE